MWLGFAAGAWAVLLALVVGLCRAAARSRRLDEQLEAAREEGYVDGVLDRDRDLRPDAGKGCAQFIEADRDALVKALSDTDGQRRGLWRAP